MKSRMKVFTIVALLFASILISAQSSNIIFPRAFAFAIDDMGWNIGNNEGDVDGVGPYRIGLDRKMDVNDYKAVVEVGKSVGVRIQGLFIMSEMDRENILGAYPESTHQGENWDNTANIDSSQIEIMNYVKENAAYLEFGLHGVGHEYWVNGEKKRAEWYCQQDDHPWPEETMRNHIELFKQLSAQYGISEENGHSFPESFVPCAYGYYWNPEGEYSTGKIMADAGVKYVNTLFDYIRELNPPEEPNGGGFDNGVIVVNRINYGNHWYKLDAIPTVDLSAQESDMIETHWSNWLAQDDFLQEATNKKFIEYYTKVQSAEDRYVAKNTEQFHSQWLYNKYTRVVEEQAGVVAIDNSAMPDDAYFNQILGNMVLKVKLPEGQHVSNASINNMPIAAYFEESGWGYIYLPTLKQDIYTLKYDLSENRMPHYVYNDGTYNVYGISVKENIIQLDLKVYGRQIIKVHTSAKPQNVTSLSKTMKVNSFNYIEEEMLLEIELKANDIQGERAVIDIVCLL